MRFVQCRVMSERSQRNGVQLAIAAYLLWGALTVYWKQLKAFDAIEVIAWRMMCAGVVMAVIVTVRGSWPTIGRAMAVVERVRSAGPRRRPLLLRELGKLRVGGGPRPGDRNRPRLLPRAAAHDAARHLRLPRGADRRAQKFAFGAAAVAVVVLTVSYGRPPWVALVIAATWSLYALVKRQSPLGAVDSLAGETFVSFIPAVIVVRSCWRAAATASPTAADHADWLFVLGTGVVTAVPLMLFAGAAQSVPFTLLGPLNLIVPVINVLLGWVVYDEPMPPDRLVGFGFVWIALVAVMWDQFSLARQGRRQQHTIEIPG